MLILRIVYNVMRKNRPIRVAICMGIADYYEHGIARGVVRYAKQREDWKLYGYGWMFRKLEDLSSWEGDGIITRAESARDARIQAGLGLPVVDVAGAYTDPRFHSVLNDDYLTGRRAGEYLRSRGFDAFAFCGVSDVRWSRKRLEGFADGAGLTGASPKAGVWAGGSRSLLPVFERALPWWEDLEAAEDLEDWLKELPRPAAVFACNDTAGVKTAGLCRNLGIPVPAGLGILGVDNEDILCELAQPSLSSIQLDCEEIGYRAAELLDLLIRREAAPGDYRSEVLVSPGAIMERESTRIFVCPDPLVQRAVTLIRSRFREDLTVSDIAREAGASRRSLEMKFRLRLGKTVHQCLLEARMAHARNLLAGTDRTVAAVAEESGYRSLQRFHQTFLKETGMTPGTWRKRNRRG